MALHSKTEFAGAQIIAMRLFQKLLSAVGFMPHGHSQGWTPALIGLHAASGSLLILACLAVPATLIYLCRKRKNLRKEAKAAGLREGTGRDSPFLGNAREYYGRIRTFHDITERKRTEETVKRLAAIVESSDDAILSKTLDGMVTSWNPAAERMFGYTAAEIIGQSLLMLVPSDLHDEESEILAGFRSGAAVRRIETVRIRKDGTRFEVAATISPITDGEGRIIGASKIVRDITEPKRAEREMARLNADLERRVAERTEGLLAATLEAERANRAQVDLLSRISHELRTPLSLIIGHGQLLEMEENLGAEPRESVEQVLRAGRRLLTLVDQLLSLSSAESDRVILQVQPVEVNQLVEETLCLVRPLAVSLAIELEHCAVPESGWTVLADSERLKRALFHLLSNGINYNHRGGKVTLSWAPVEASDPPALRFCVKDTGPGVSAADLSRLFTPFARLDQERAGTHVAGAGLGLALSKWMVELMGGRIGVESAPGEGSTFWIEAPLTAHLPAPHAEVG